MSPATAHAGVVTDRRAERRATGWFYLMIAGVVAIHVLAGAMTRMTIDLMRNVTPFALEVFAHNRALLPYFQTVVYGVLTPLSIAYVWPLRSFVLDGCPQPAPLRVQRRAISLPTVLGLIGFSGWAAGIVFWPTLTYFSFGRWSTELMSQQVLSPLVNGFFAATSAYLFADWIARCSVIPRVFPDGHTSAVAGAFTLGVRGRLFVFLAAVAFLPLFTMYGLVRAARVRFDAGVDATTIVDMLDVGSTGVFVVYVSLGLVLTLLLARSFTGPLANIAAALRSIQAGRLDVGVPVDSGDELGLLEEGVNDMAASLRERERILAAFGRVVEPAVRDRLLSGDIALGGEMRTATILFCDIRGFTSFAERMPPQEVVATLNEFFTVTTQWVRGCGGFVDKFIGDAILVVFGLFDEAARTNGAEPPGGTANGGPEADDVAYGDAGARMAIRCALGLRERLAEFNRARAAARKPALAVAVAVHTGEVLAGTIGAADRHEYTVIGDTVNTAARLLDVCKEMNCDLVVSERAFELASRGGAEMAIARRDSVVLRGRAEPVAYLTVA